MSLVRACSLTLAPLRGGLHGRRNCGIGIELLKHDALIPFHAESLSILGEDGPRAVTALEVLAERVEDAHEAMGEHDAAHLREPSDLLCADRSAGHAAILEGGGLGGEQPPTQRACRPLQRSMHALLQALHLLSNFEHQLRVWLGVVCTGSGACAGNGVRGAGGSGKLRGATGAGGRSHSRCSGSSGVGGAGWGAGGHGTEQLGSRGERSTRTRGRGRPGRYAEAP